MITKVIPTKLRQILGRDRQKQTPLLGQGHQSWDPDDRGMAGKGSQEVVITLVWLRRKVSTLFSV